MRIACRRDTLVALLSMKFGPLPESVRRTIDGASASDLETWSLRVLTAGSIDDVMATRR